MNTRSLTLRQQRVLAMLYHSPFPLPIVGRATSEHELEINETTVTSLEERGLVKVVEAGWETKGKVKLTPLAYSILEALD